MGLQFKRSCVLHFHFRDGGGVIENDFENPEVIGKPVLFHTGRGFDYGRVSPVESLIRLEEKGIMKIPSFLWDYFKDKKNVLIEGSYVVETKNSYYYAQLDEDFDEYAPTQEL